MLTEQTEKDPVITGEENKDVTETPFEVEGQNVTPEETGKVVPLDGEKMSQQEVAKLDMNVVNLNAWKKKYSGVTIANFEDKENYDLAKEGKKLAKTARIALEKKRVMLVAPLVQAQKAVNDKAKEYGAIIAQIEAPMDKELEKWEEWEKADEERKEKEKQRVLNDRVEKLLAAGMHFSGAFYVIGETMSMDIASIKNLTDADFDFFIEKVKLEKGKLDKAEQERIEAQKAEDERKAKEQEALAEKQRELDKQKEDQAAAAKILEDEKLAMRQERLQMREQMAHNAGLTFNPSTMAYEFKNKYSDQAITKEVMETMETPEFSELIKNVSFIIKTAKDNADAAEKKERDLAEIIDARKSQLRRLGLVGEGERFYLPTKTWLPIDQIEVLQKTIKDATEPGWKVELDTITAKVESAERLQRIMSARLDFLMQSDFARNDAGTTFTKRKDGIFVVLVTLEDVAGNDEHWENMLQTISANTKKVDEAIARTDARKNQCVELGLKWDGVAYVYDATLFINFSALQTLDPVEWAQLWQEVKEEKERIELLQAQKERIFNDRVDFLINLGMKKEGVFLHYQNQFGDKYTFDLRTIDHETPNDKWIALADNAQDTISEYKQLEATKLREAEEAKEKAKPELEKVASYFLALAQVDPPAVDNEKLLEVLVQFSIDMGQTIQTAKGIISKLGLE